jgi:hypothetical protein
MLVNPPPPHLTELKAASLFLPQIPVSYFLNKSLHVHQIVQINYVSENIHGNVLKVDLIYILE